FRQSWEPSRLRTRIGSNMHNHSRRGASVPRFLFPVPAVLALILGAACDNVAPLFNRPRAVSAHQRYADGLAQAGLDSTALGRDWIAAAKLALRQPITVTLPLREAGYFAAS